MRIDNQHISSIQKAYNQQQKTAAAEKAKQQKKGDDMINLSAEARLWSSALQAVRELPENNERKIEKISEAVRNGDYYVSNEDIAEKIWQESIFDKKV